MTHLSKVFPWLLWIVVAHASLMGSCVYEPTFLVQVPAFALVDATIAAPGVHVHLDLLAVVDQDVHRVPLSRRDRPEGSVHPASLRVIVQKHDARPYFFSSRIGSTGKSFSAKIPFLFPEYDRVFPGSSAIRIALISSAAAFVDVR